MEQCLRPLLDYLASTRTPAESEWGGWTIRPTGGGLNNLLYRATNREHDLAVKFTVRDRRDRAARELSSRSLFSNPFACGTWRENRR